MSRLLFLSFLLASLPAIAEDVPASAPPKPTKEHDLLRQFAGEWQVTKMLVPAPTDATAKCEGTESAQMLGGFCLVAETKTKIHDEPFHCLVTIGYDERVKKYIATYVSSRDSHVWRYTGEMNAAGNTLSAETAGPSLFEPAKNTKYRCMLELKDKDHKVYRSDYLREDGFWNMLMIVEYERKK